MIPVYKYLPSRVNLPFLEAWENKAFSRDDDNYMARIHFKIIIRLRSHFIPSVEKCESSRHRII